MAFVADNAALRTFDAERGLELLSRWPPEQDPQFRIEGSGFLLRFSAAPGYEAVPGVDPALPVEASKVLIWHVQPFFNAEAVERHRALIQEVLTAFKGVHGYPARQRVKVAFPPTPPSITRRPGGWWRRLAGRVDQEGDGLR